MGKHSCFIAVLLVGGLGGIIAQTVLVRELLILFSGNELSIGVIIGSWVIWEATGSYLGGKGNRKDPTDFLILSIILFSIFFPVSIYFARAFKTMVGISSGIGIGLAPTLLSSVVILLPTGFLHGFFFTVACSAHDRTTGEGASSTGKVYFYEMLGTIAGGVLINYLLIAHYNSFQIAIGVALAGATACILLAWSTGISKKPMAATFCAALIAASLALLTGGRADLVNKASVERQWPGQNVVYYGNSVYQNIVVVRNENQYTFFTDGIPAITTPVPDIAFAEEFAHFPLLAHPSPENVLVLGGGAGGLINEIIKHPSVRNVDYVETDPLMLTVVKSFSTSLTRRELGHPFVHLSYLDGRTFLKHVQAAYDVILLGLPPPYTLRANRFFTTEFFEMAKAHLKENGIFALTLTGSLAYYGKELKELNVSILRTLESVFPHIYVIPGDTNLLMASRAPGTTLISPALLYGRLQGRRIKTDLITFSHLNYRLDEQWRRWFSASIGDTRASINRDLSPKGLFYHMGYLNLLFSPYLKPFFDLVSRINAAISIAFVGAFFLLFYFLSRRWSNTNIVYAIATTGFTAIILELILLFSFQVFYGYVFREIGILITVFMTGMAAGSLVVIIYLHRIKRTMALFIGVEAITVLFCIALLLLSFSVEPAANESLSSIRVMFFFLLFVSGLLTGFEFPLANRIYQAGSIGRTAGMLYSADLFGGWVGGLVGGIVFLPVLGLSGSCIVLVALKMSSILLLLTPRRK